MKNKYTPTDNTLKMINVAFAVLLTGFGIFLLFKMIVGDVQRPTGVPFLDLNKLQVEFNELDNRHDVQTNGKPDINKFSFGNEEPF